MEGGRGGEGDFLYRQDTGYIARRIQRGALRLRAKMDEFVSLALPHRGLVPCASYLAGGMYGGGGVGAALVGAAAVGVLYASQAVYNNILDREGDRINSPERALARGDVGVEGAVSTMSLLAAVGVMLAVAAGPAAVLLAPGYLLLGWFYSSVAKGRWYLSYPTLAASHHVLPFSVGYLVAGAPGWPLLLAVGFIFASTALAISIKDYKDVEGDGRLGLDTLPLAFGRRRAAWLTTVGLIAPLPLLALALPALHWPTGRVLLYLGTGLYRAWIALRLVSGPAPATAKGLLISFRNVTLVEMLSWFVPWGS